MNRKLYLFNPEHDLALANGDANFHAPQSARVFAKDLACFPMWFAEANGVVLGAMPYLDWLKEMKQLFPQLSTVSVVSKPDLSEIEVVQPWGWNAAAVKYLADQGVDIQVLPEEHQIDVYRKLSHRETAIKAMNYLREVSELADLIPFPAQLLCIDEVADFVKLNQSVVFKSPWSSSGKGLCWTNNPLTDSTLGWCRNVWEKQGAVVGEQVYDKIQDFAMEFLCKNGEVSFAGYSLFCTERGVYKSNELMSDDAIVEKLTQEWIQEEVLLKVQRQLIAFITKEISPSYTGYLGVDLFVYEQNHQFMLHPCVEINLRMTMGMVAHIFYDRFVADHQTGRFFIDHYPKAGSLLEDHLQRQISLPMQVVNGKITGGYLSLSPISKNSHYRARVEVG